MATPFLYIWRSTPCCKLDWYSWQLFDHFPLRPMHILYMHLFQAIRKSFWRHFTTFSAVLFLVRAEASWQTGWYCCKWCITSFFGWYTGLNLDEFGQPCSVKWWKLKGSQLHTRVAAKPSTPTSFSDLYRACKYTTTLQPGVNQWEIA